MNGVLVIFSGPSGVGKDTLLEAWQAVNPRVERVVAACTRAPRPGEVDGVDYHFKTVEEFEQMILDGAFLEHKKVYDNYYGTPLSDMERRLSEGKMAVLKIDAQGALDAMQIRPDAVTIFTLPPTNEELERRIRSRGTDSEEQIQKRLASALWEIEQSAHYQHRVVNDDLSRAVLEIEGILSPSGGGSRG